MGSRIDQKQFCPRRFQTRVWSQIFVYPQVVNLGHSVGSLATKNLSCVPDELQFGTQLVYRRPKAAFSLASS